MKALPFLEENEFDIDIVWFVFNNRLLGIETCDSLSLQSLGHHHNIVLFQPANVVLLKLYPTSPPPSAAAAAERVVIFL